MSDADHRRRIDRILDPGFLLDIADVSLDELRERRKMCDSVDTELSYYRRLLHGRMDLLAFELRRRRGEETRTLLEALPEIIAGSEQASSSATRELPVEVPDLPEVGRRPVDRALEDDFLGRLPSIDDDELAEIQAKLTEAETEVSAQRKGVYDAYERISAELTRRYGEGLADADELLRSN